MGAWEIVLIIACSLIVIGVIVSNIIKKAKGKPTCDCGCDCAHCSSCCHNEESEDVKKILEKINANVK